MLMLSLGLVVAGLNSGRLSDVRWGGLAGERERERALPFASLCSVLSSLEIDNEAKGHGRLLFFWQLLCCVCAYYWMMLMIVCVSSPCRSRAILEV